jgi:NADPH:quinone reductase-like Zn-dependent oxidoreductase
MSTQRAVVHKSKDVAEVKNDVPLPKLPGDDWILVKTKAVALNPTDWKNIANTPSPGALAGCDYAGVVEEVGKGVENLKIGDRVAGFVRGGKSSQPLFQEKIAELFQATLPTMQTALLQSTSRPKQVSMRNYTTTYRSRMARPWALELQPSLEVCTRNSAYHSPQTRSRRLHLS